MFARVATVQVPAEKVFDVSDAAKGFRDQTLPNVKKMKGFKHAYLLVDRKTGKGHAIFLFDTEANLKASADRASELRTQVTQAVGATVLAVEEFEVAYES